jgi:hypothetical protein
MWLCPCHFLLEVQSRQASGRRSQLMMKPARATAKQRRDSNPGRPQMAQVLSSP